MSAKSIHFEIAALVILSLIPWPNTSNPGLKCLSENSRAVRKVIEKRFIPILDRYKAALPLDCPFHASRDIYGRKREGPELEGEPPSLVCWICGLTFGSEKHLQEHYSDVHADSLVLQEGAICLADYCTIMRCNVLLANEWLASLNASKGLGKEGKRYKWEVLDWVDEEESVGKNAAREALKGREEAKRGNCNASELKELQRKCQMIIRSCIAGLLLSLSPKDFQEIEEDMNRAVCSFLTCEKFWEDSLVEEPRYPLGFFLAVLAMLGIGMIICYYIVWVVFDSGDMYGHEECYEVFVLYGDRMLENEVQRHDKCEAKRKVTKR